MMHNEQIPHVAQTMYQTLVQQLSFSQTNIRLVKFS